MINQIIVMFKATFLTLKQLLILVLLNVNPIMVLFGSNLLTHLFIDYMILEPLSP